MSFETAEEAQQAFYAAFEAGDAAAMMEVWLDGPASVCIHPGGDALRGGAEIRRSWRAILQGGGAGRIEFKATAISQDDALAVFTGFELITPSGGAVPFPPVLATNVYRRIGDGWRMVLHHASQVLRTFGSTTPDATRH